MQFLDNKIRAFRCTSLRNKSLRLRIKALFSRLEVERKFGSAMVKSYPFH